MKLDPELDPDPDPLVRSTDPGIRIRIRSKMSRIPNTDKWKDFHSCHQHCKENPIYVFTQKKLRGLSPNFHIHGYL